MRTANPINTEAAYITVGRPAAVLRRSVAKQATEEGLAFQSGFFLGPPHRRMASAMARAALIL